MVRIVGNVSNSNNAKQDARPKLERRKDNKKRQAIAKIEQYFFSTNAQSQIYQAWLGCLAEYSKSDIGECYSFTHDANNQTHIKKEASYGEFDGDLVDTDTIDRWMQHKSMLACPVFYNHPIPDASKLILKPDFQQASLIIIPILNDKVVVAVCVLQAENREFHARLFSEIAPITAAAACCLQFSELVNNKSNGIFENINTKELVKGFCLFSPCGVMIADSSDKVVFANDKLRSLYFDFDWDAENRTQNHFFNTDMRSLLPNFNKVLQWSNQGMPFTGEAPNKHAKVWQDEIFSTESGEFRTVDLTLFKFFSDTNHFTVLQIVDITEQKEEEAKFKRQSQEFEALTQLLPVAIIKVNKHWDCVFSNEKWFDFSGVNHNENNTVDWINVIHSQDVTRLLTALRECLEAGKDLQQEVRLVDAFGSVKWVDFNSRVIFNLDGEVDGFIGTFADVTERFLAQERLRLVAQYDGLTGLANKGLFQDRLQQAFFDSERDDSVVSVFFLDMDGFKQVNDTAGHNVGDELLKKVAERLLNCLRKNDTVARFGGDEFVVLLGKDSQTSDVSVVAKKVIQSVASPFLINEHEINITTSLGLAQGSHSNSNAELLLKNADIALYQAKDEGKNTFKVFDKNMENNSKARLGFMQQLRKGIDHDAYFLQFQPIVEASTSRVLGFEALLRFNDENDAVVYPNEFIEHLEDSGLIIDVGFWVFETVCAQLKEWQNTKRFPNDGYISFNVAAKQLSDHNFANDIINCCKTYSLNPKHLVLEITESTIITNPNKVEGVLRELREFGIRIALDDFGTGFSSMSYLQKYPFDFLKIDKSFVQDLSNGSNDFKIIKATIGLAKSFGLTVCAEGVETDYVRKRISELGADSMQGFLLSKPMDSDKVIDYLNTSE